MVPPRTEKVVARRPVSDGQHRRSETGVDAESSASQGHAIRGVAQERCAVVRGGGVGGDEQEVAWVETLRKSRSKLDTRGKLLNIEALFVVRS